METIKDYSIKLAIIFCFVLAIIEIFLTFVTFSLYRKMYAKELLDFIQKKDFESIK